MNHILVRNIRALLDKRREEEKQAPLQMRIADRITTFVGSMKFVYIHLALFGTWIAINSGLLGLPKFDRTFVVLGMAASVEAIFLSTFVLISQNRMAANTERRADLDLQISLLAEHEITRLLQLVSRMHNHLGLHDADEAALSELKQDVAPHRVLDRIEEEEAQCKEPAGK